MKTLYFSRLPLIYRTGDCDDESESENSCEIPILNKRSADTDCFEMGNCGGACQMVQWSLFIVHAYAVIYHVKMLWSIAYDCLLIIIVICPNV